MKNCYFIYKGLKILNMTALRFKKFNIEVINNKISIINSACKFWSVKGTKPSFMKVKNVTIPIKIHKNEDKIIQLKFFIILNILN